MSSQGSCNFAKHITKRVWRALDLAQWLVHKIEKSTYWVEKAAEKLKENMFVIHKLEFEAVLATSPLSKVSAKVDFTVFQTRHQLAIELSLASLIENAKKIADMAIAGFMNVFRPRYSNPVYDPPNQAADYALSGKGSTSSRKNFV